MNLQLYKSFYQVAKSGSISKASEQLYISQPAVSRSIKQLEREMGCSLFLRAFTGVKLTKEGEILYQHIEQAFKIIALAEKKISELNKVISGEIKIGCSNALCKYHLQFCFKTFNSYHPSVKINVMTGTSASTINLLKSGKIDFGVINMPYQDEQLNFKETLQVQDCFVAGEKFKHLTYNTLPLIELTKYPLLLLEKSSNVRHFIDMYFERNSISATPDYELPNIDLLTSFAKNNFGIACVVKNFIKDDLEKGELFELEVVEKIPPRSLSAVWLKDIPLSAAANELMHYLLQ